MITQRAAARLATLTTLVALLGGTAAPAFAQYPPISVSGAVSDATLVPGQPLTVSGDGWQPGSTVAIDFLSVPTRIGGATADASGEFAVEVDVPRGATPGAHTVRLSGTAPGRQPRVVNLAVTVVADDDDDADGGVSGSTSGGSSGATGGGDRLAVTGENLTVAITLLTLLSLAGVLTLVSGRRRSRSAR